MEESSFKVYDWMVHKLRLKGNELLCYALIYRVCEEMGSCPMTFKEISKQTGMSFPTVGTVIKSLCKKGYINKKQFVYENFPYNSYTINKKEDGTLQR
jgi:DNA-binding MarR family transcriptional regulator